jgi:hypothetical protein
MNRYENKFAKWRQKLLEDHSNMLRRADRQETTLKNAVAEVQRKETEIRRLTRHSSHLETRCRDNAERNRKLERNLQMLAFQIPSRYCPITLDEIEKPCLCLIDGRIYEDEAIQQWVNSHGTSPFTRDRLQSRDLVEIKQSARPSLPAPNAADRPFRRRRCFPSDAFNACDAAAAADEEEATTDSNASGKPELTHHHGGSGKRARSYSLG